MQWKVIITEEYEAWLQGLPPKHRQAIVIDLEVLGNVGPLLGRPQVDQIKGSEIHNLKELRTACGGSVYRSLFVFDPARQAVILCGGDKKGKDQAAFYRKLIAEAERIFQNHLDELREKR